MEKAASTEASIKDMQTKRIALSIKIRELRLDARKLDADLHRVGGAGAMISCW